MCFAEDRLSNGYTKVFEAQIPLILDRLRQENIEASTASGRATFIGNTTDGTLYRFTTIKPEEWALLYFIEGLWLQDKEMSSTATRSFAQTSSHESESRPSVPTPLQMHVNGDILAGMLEPGNAGLRDLLKVRVKLESEAGNNGEIRERLQRLRELAEPLLGPSNDLAGAVSVWLRNLLQWPAR